ncbi:hypothetical protein LINPERHAP2_LOCUS42291 [Linum perenne]
MAVWIKLSRVPSHCITTRFGRGFLRYFGEVIDISLFGSSGRDAVFIKGLARIDLLASFLGRMQACGPDNVLFWVRLHYENIASMCYRCGFLGHPMARCPHTDIPVDLEVRGSWMSIGRVGFRILENSLQKYIQNQAKGKKGDLVNSEVGQFSFVTKEKRFGYSVQPNGRRNDFADNEFDVEKHAVSDRVPNKIKGSNETRNAGGRKNQRAGAGISEGWTPTGEFHPKSLKSAPTVLNNANQKVIDAQKNRDGVYVPPGKRRMEAKSSIGSSKAACLNSSVHSRPPPTAGKSLSLPTKRKLVFGNKGKGKLIHDARPVIKKGGVQAKGIVIQEPGSGVAQPLSSSSNISWKSRYVPPPANVAGPSKVGEWMGPGEQLNHSNAGAEIPQIGFARKAHSLELIRNLYQVEDEEEKDEECPPMPAAAASAPVQIHSANSESVDQTLQDASLEDIGWLRPVIGRWADVVDSDEEDQYAEEALGEKEELIVPRDESGEDDVSDDDAAELAMWFGLIQKLVLVDFEYWSDYCLFQMQMMVMDAEQNRWAKRDGLGRRCWTWKRDNGMLFGWVISISFLVVVSYRKWTQCNK